MFARLITHADTTSCGAAPVVVVDTARTATSFVRFVALGLRPNYPESEPLPRAGTGIFQTDEAIAGMKALHRETKRPTPKPGDATAC